MDQQTADTLKAPEIPLAQLYLSTCEALSRYAYEAVARQQQMNTWSLQVTANSVRDLYAVFTPEAPGRQV